MQNIRSNVGRKAPSHFWMARVYKGLFTYVEICISPFACDKHPTDRKYTLIKTKSAIQATYGVRSRSHGLACVRVDFCFVKSQPAQGLILQQRVWTRCEKKRNWKRQNPVRPVIWLQNERHLICVRSPIAFSRVLTQGWSMTAGDSFALMFHLVCYSMGCMQRFLWEGLSWCWTTDDSGYDELTNTVSGVNLVRCVLL